MKALINILIILIFTSGVGFNNTPVNGKKSSQELSKSSSADFSILTTAINTKYSEFGSGIYKDKLIIFSSKKIGGLGNGIDPSTNQPYMDLFCVDIKKYGELSRPLLFSRILNTKDNEGQITFSEDEKTIYFTRSSRDNSQNYQLYRAEMDPEIQGNWINIKELEISSPYYSIETPYLKGNKLYFSSNMSGTYGGFDLFVAEVKKDGTLGAPKNLGETVNTAKDEKFPFLTKDGKYLYFSSKGHENLGGFDVFASRVANKEYRSPKNLGNSINSKDNEVAFFLTKDNEGYISSDKDSGKGYFDIYRFYKEDIKQILKGIVVDAESKIPLPNTEVILIDEEGREIGRQITNENAEYDFPVVPFDFYTIKTVKDGFENGTTMFEAVESSTVTYTKNLELVPTKAAIVEVDDKLMISIENIYFDFNKWNIKKESTISLDKVVDVLNSNPEMKIEINAHTDNVGKNSYNQILSEKRAASAMQYLISKGINENRLKSHGFGETQPRIDCGQNCSKAQDQINRRIEFVIEK